MNYVVDTTLGTLLAYVFHRLFLSLARRLRWVRVMDSGKYGSPPSCVTLLLQVLSWELVILLTKAVVAGGFMATYTPLGRLVNALSRPFVGKPGLELTLVMVVRNLPYDDSHSMCNALRVRGDFARRATLP